MGDQYLGEIRAVPYNFAPKGWALCNGQLLQIPQNTALFSILGTSYGGDGRTTFALPNLQNRTPIQTGQGPGLSSYSLGAMGGASTVSLTQAEMSPHAHALACDPAGGTQQGAAGGVWAASGAGRATPPYYATDATKLTPMSPAAVGFTGAGQPHNNRSPYLGLTFIIAVEGIYPPRG
jgi:microcystin-dependent protein